MKNPYRTFHNFYNSIKDTFKGKFYTILSNSVLFGIDIKRVKCKALNGV